MKRVLSFFLVVILSCSFCIGSLFSIEAKGAAFPEKITGLKISTADKRKQLKLIWDKQSNVDGYQIYRSTTGKSGSFKKIATISKKTVYVDKNLKSSTAYFYKVRAYVKQDGKIVSGPFSKGNLSTKITASFAVKRFNQAYKALSKLTLPSDLNGDYILRKNIYGYQDVFSSMEGSNYTSKADIQKYLESYFTKELAKTITNHFFVQANGTLYLWTPEAGMLGETNYNKTTAKIVKTTDKTVTVKVTRIHEIDDWDIHDIESYIYLTTLVYSNGKWLFNKGSVWTEEAFYV